MLSPDGMCTVLFVDKQSEFGWKYRKILEFQERKLFSRYSPITVIVGAMSLKLLSSRQPLWILPSCFCDFW